MTRASPLTSPTCSTATTTRRFSPDCGPTARLSPPPRRFAGRAPETGAFARHWRKTDFYGGAATARLGARMIDLAESLDRLSRAAAGEETDQAEAHSVALAAREGFAAVETSRGRLYHWTRLSRDGKIEDYAIVAPTEWNFHPAGPFVAGAARRAGVRGRRRRVDRPARRPLRPLRRFSRRGHGAGSCMRWR